MLKHLLFSEIVIPFWGHIKYIWTLYTTIQLFLLFIRRINKDSHIKNLIYLNSSRIFDDIFANFDLYAIIYIV